MEILPSGFHLRSGGRVGWGGVGWCRESFALAQTAQLSPQKFYNDYCYVLPGLLITRCFSSSILTPTKIKNLQPEQLHVDEHT